MKRLCIRLFIPLLLASGGALAHSPPDSARIDIVGLQDGDVVTSPLRLQFSIKDFGIAPAGTTGRKRHTTGHYHLLVDLDQLPDMNAPIPRDEHHLHFDQGESEALIELAPGEHSLQLLLGDEEHEPHAPPLISRRVSIQVKE